MTGEPLAKEDLSRSHGMGVRSARGGAAPPASGSTAPSFRSEAEDGEVSGPRRHASGDHRLQSAAVERGDSQIARCVDCPTPRFWRRDQGTST